MAGASSTKRNSAEIRGPRKAKARRVARDYRQFDMAGMVAELVGQYQTLVTQQIEDEVRHKALVQVEEGGRALRYQTRERLMALEVEVQRGMELVLARARERIFRMVNEEMERVFEHLDENLRGLVDEADEAGVVAEEPTHGFGGEPEEAAETPLEALVQDVSRGLIGASVAEREPVQLVEEAEEGEGVGVEVEKEELEWPQGPRPTNERLYEGEVDIEIMPPFSLAPLLHLHRHLRQSESMSIVRALGSTKKGQALSIRLSQPVPLLENLRRIPVVREVAEVLPGRAAPDGSEGGAHRVIRVLLREE